MKVGEKKHVGPNQFTSKIRVELGNKDQILFWKDMCFCGTILRFLFLNLFSFVGNKKIVLQTWVILSMNPKNGI